MRKVILPLLFILFALNASAYAYEISLSGNIDLPDSISAVSNDSLAGIVAAASKTSNALYIIDVNKNTVVKKYALDFTPVGLAMDEKRGLLIIASDDNTLQQFDIKTGEVIRTITPGIVVDHIAIHKESDTLYIAGDKYMQARDLETFSGIKELELPFPVTSMAIDRNGLFLLLAEEKPGLYVYTPDHLEYLYEIKSELNFSSVAVNPSTRIAVLTNTVKNNLTIASLEGGQILANTSLNEKPHAIAIDWKNNIVLIAHDHGIAKVQLENPVPSIATLVPKSAREGDPGLTLTIEGSNFVGASQTGFNEKDMPTFFVTNETLKAEISPENLTRHGDVPVTVTSPPPGGGVSNACSFKIYTPAPVLDTLSPAAVITGSAATMRVRGRNFFNGSTVNLNGENLKTRFISSILLEAEAGTAYTKKTGLYPVVVINPAPNSFTSNMKNLSVIDEKDSVQANPSDTAIQANANAGVGSLKGRIVNTNLIPLAGVGIKIKNLKSVTDSNGYFLLENIPAGKRVLLIDGSTEKVQTNHYPTIPINVDIEPGIINEMPFQVYLHQQKNRNFKQINPAEDTILTDSEVPGFEMRIPKGVHIIGWDGQPNLKVSVRTVPTDRLPVKPLPQNAMVRTVYMFYFSKVGGGTPDQPIPIKAKNDLNLLPGEKAVLWYYDESPNEGEAPNDWAIAGTGTVTPDGQYIVADPGVGIPKFCCGATAWGGSGSSSDPTGSSPCGKGGDPVDLATGYFTHEHTDLSIPGIIPVNITRYYRGKDASGNEGLGAFGKNMYFEYDWWLGTYQDMLLLIKPGNYQYKFIKQPDNTYINSTDPAMRGAVITITGSTKTLRTTNGASHKFDSSGKLIEMADRNGNTLTLERHSDFEGGYIQRIITPEGRTVTFNQVYTGNFVRTDSITDDTGRVVIYTYDTYNSYPRLTKVTFPDGSTIQYQYDTSGRMSGIVNQKGIAEVTNEYDVSNRVTRQTHPDGGIFNFSYAVAGGHITETSMTEPNGAVKTWRFYDDTGAFRDKYITRKITPDGTTTYDLEATSNLLKSVTDALGRTMSYTYYANGLTNTVTDNLGNVTSYEYESTYGLPTKITDALGKITTLTYTFSSGKVTKTEIRDPLMNLLTINYNTYGLTTSVTDPNGNTTTLLYENAGKPAELTKIINPLNNTFLAAYDSLGRVSQVTDADGNTTSYGYDMMNRVTSVTDALDNVTRYYRDLKGNISMVIDPKGNVIQYEYDDRDRLTRMIDQLGRFETYAYYRGSEITPTTGDNLKSITDRKGQITTFNQYDMMNRLKKVTYHDGSYVDYTYDAAGRVDYINDSVSGFIDYTYNDFGCSNCSGNGMDRIAQETTPLGTINYTYDEDGRKTTMTVAGQPVVNYTYDDAGRLTKVSRSINGTVNDFAIAYDNGGRRTSFQEPLMTTTYSYDIANRLLSMVHQGPSAQIENLIYEYAPNGNRTSFTRNAAQTLRYAVTGTSYDDANRMLSITPVTGSAKDMIYDENGNLLTSTSGCGTTTYTWDARNRLTGISGFNADCSQLSAAFAYDALGRRIQKTINGIATQYVYDGLDIIQEIQGTAKTDYIRTLNIDEPLTRIKADGTVRHFVRDALGSVIGLTDDTGVLKTTYTYDPFGNVTVSGEASDNPFQYTGRENDGTGLYYYRARYYSPELQRFISEDPIGFEGGSINLYEYVGNQPGNFVDPLGLWTFSVGVNLGGYLGAFGGEGGTSLNFGYSRHRGFSFSITGTAGGGAATGLGGSLGISVTGSDACSVDQLTGSFIEVNRGVGPVSVTGFSGGGVKGGGIIIGLPSALRLKLSPQGSGMVTTTTALFQYANGAVSIGDTGHDSLWRYKR